MHQLQDLIKAWQARRGLAVAVTNEVGSGLVSKDLIWQGVYLKLLGVVEPGDGDCSDEVIMVVAGGVAIVTS